MGSFLYPRSIEVHRPKAQVGVGFQPAYAGEVIGDETRILGKLPAEGLPCSIQARRDGQRNPVDLPGDGSKTTWYCYIPQRAARKGSILGRDIVVDELGARYQVIHPYWDSLGYRLTLETLEA